MKDCIAFMLLLLFAGFADGLMEKSEALFMIVGVLTVGTAWVLIELDWRRGKR